ncbi:hypothetical protein C8T65DRAFT_269256 [Cerioporus squamosus]|nr:hypothetical protein C8T65DRAFT_269256 [Cerioporus squamosus]
MLETQSQRAIAPHCFLISLSAMMLCQDAVHNFAIRASRSIRSAATRPTSLDRALENNESTDHPFKSALAVAFLPQRATPLPNKYFEAHRSTPFTRPRAGSGLAQPQLVGAVSGDGQIMLSTSKSSTGATNISAGQSSVRITLKVLSH